MVKLLMIADDFTGALDTGIQFAKKGIKTQIFTEQAEEEDIKVGTEVLVIDAESRPMTAKQAGFIVGSIVKWALDHGIEWIFKKTDSALRGNIGAELEAACVTAGKRLYFLPANPAVGRITRGGVHYIDGELLENSVFRGDPFESVTKSYIPDIIREQSRISVVCIGRGDSIPKDNVPGIAVCDAESMDDIDKRLDELFKKNRIGLVAGCAALACRLVERLPFRRLEEKGFHRAEGLFVACGSLNPITEEQLDYAEREEGFLRIHLTMEQKLLAGYYDTEEGKEFLKRVVSLCRKKRKVIVDTFDFGESKEKFLKENNISKESVRELIAGAHGRIVKAIVEQGMNVTVLMTGGDTLMGYMKRVGCRQLEPVCELEPGVVLSILELDGKHQQVISKSGGYGEIDTLCRIARKILKD